MEIELSVTPSDKGSPTIMAVSGSVENVNSILIEFLDENGVVVASQVLVNLHDLAICIQYNLVIIF